MMRLLLILGILILIGYLVAYWFKRHLRKLMQQFVASQEPTQTLTQTLVECQFCHTFFPISKAVKSQNRIFCCQEHADLSK